MLKKCERLLTRNQNGIAKFHIVPATCKTCGKCTRRTHADKCVNVETRHCFMYIWLGNLFFCIIIAWHRLHQNRNQKTHILFAGLVLEISCFGLSQKGVFQVNEWPQSNFLTDQLKDFPLACDYFLILSSSVGGALFLALSLEICKRATDSHVSSYSHVVIMSCIHYVY